MAAGVKRRNRKVGKNKKKGWRSIDITDVEQHLEDERLQERTGCVCNTITNYNDQ